MSNNRVAWLAPDDPPDSFPAIELALAEPDGLLAAGGDLSAERLLQAYRSGIFPWYEEGQPLLWWSPNPRCVFLPGNFRLSRRMQRAVRTSTAEIRINTCFSSVVRACAGPRRSEQGTWITEDMIVAYVQLHRLGWAHSIEVWDGGELVGGLYGLAIGNVFFGESMFSKMPNASKFALQYLANRLQAGEFDLLDCQVVSGHLLRLGATSIPRTEFVKRLDCVNHGSAKRADWPKSAISVASLMG